ncbi:Ig-like domain-containing protein, partial [Paenibacillus sepulcri]|nr:Ig-like domain-containing protein [Paenibacillus sepulcri]
MFKPQVLLKALSSVLLFALVLPFINLSGLPASPVHAAPANSLGLLDIELNKPVNAEVDLDHATIHISLPYGTLYQMLNVTMNPGASAALYRSDGTTAVSFAASGMNNGDAKMDQFSTSGTTLYYLAVTDKNDSSSIRRYTITVTVDMSLPPITGPMGSNDKYLPLNIQAHEHAWDVMGASKIGNGSTTGSIEGPGTPSSYSGISWPESVYDRSGDYPMASIVDESWLGDNMYLQTIGKSNVDALTKYGIANIPGAGKLNSDILRFHEFSPFVAPGGVSRDDGDRGAVNSDRQRLEIKSSTSAANMDANSFGGDIMTHHWRLMLPSETLRYQKDTGDKHAGDFIVPHRFWHIFQLKEVAGNAAGQPVATLSLVSSGGKGQLEFRNNPDGSYADRIKPLFTIPFDRVVDRWLDFEVTILTADKGYLYGKLVDLETGEVLFEGGMTAETYRRPEINNPATGRDERGDLPVEPGQQNRSKWGLYRGMYNGPGDAAFADEFQSATMYLADVHLIKRDENSYIFPDGWNPNVQPKDMAAWARPQEITASKGTPFSQLLLPAQLDVTLSTGKTEKVNVSWSPEGYNPDNMGTYKIFGEFASPGITNTKNIKPYIVVSLTDSSSVAIIPVSTASYTVNPGGPSINTAAGGNTPTGRYLQTSSTPVAGDWVEVTVDVPETGNYDIEFGYKSNNNRGIAQLYVDGVSQGSPVDEYHPAQTFPAADMGSSILEAGSHKFRFVVTGKNAGSSGYHLTFDYIKLARKDAAP